MQEGEKVRDYCVRVNDVVNKLATLGDTIDKQVVIKNVVRSLTTRSNHIAIVIEEIKNVTKLQFDHLVGYIISHEGRVRYSFAKCDEKYFSTKL